MNKQSWSMRLRFIAAWLLAWQVFAWPTATQDWAGHPATNLCAVALDPTGTQWNSDPSASHYVDEAQRRGYTVSFCRSFLPGLDAGQIAKRAPQEPAPTPTVASNPNGPEALTSSIQALLLVLGFDPGPADGVAGAKTSAAIQAFQRRDGVAVDGQPSQALLARLQAVVAGKRSPAPATAPAAPTPPPTSSTSTPTVPPTANGSAFDDAEAQLKVRQAASAVNAASLEIDDLRRSLEAERKRVVPTDEERELNQETVRTLEKKLRDAEAKKADRDTALKDVQEERRKGLAAETQRQKLEEARHPSQQTAAAPQQSAPLKGPGWLADPATGCRVWDASPEPGEAISWTGGCEKNLAQGRGVLQWFLNGKQTARYEGEYRDGKANGRGVYTWASGTRYEGEFSDDRPNGSGTLTRTNGTVFSGLWTNGCFRQGDRKAAVMASYKECGF